MTCENLNNDLVLVCADCQADFLFSQGEQRFYRERDLQVPKCCQRCRLARRQEREAAGQDAPPAR